MAANAWTRGAIAASAVLTSMSTYMSADAPAATGFSRRSVSCQDAWRIFAAAAAAGESNSQDFLLVSPPEFPTVAVPPSKSRTGLVLLTPDSTWWRGNWSGVRPSADLIRRWFAAPYRSIAICLDKGEKGRTLGSVPGWRPSPKSTMSNVRYNVQATYPVVDASHTHALLVYSTSAANWIVGGKAELVLLERRGSEWRRVGAGFISVS